MKVLLVHNRYQQAGGEDRVFTAEGDLLEAHGHQVVTYTAHNREVDALGRLELARTTIWSQRAYRELGVLMRLERPQVMHVHNTLPLLSPAVYYAARKYRVAVVQTLHNYRILCPNALLFRAGGACEACLGRAFAWPSVVHACYRHSRAASAVVATSNAVHRALGTWRTKVDRFITLTEFSRGKFVAGGLPSDRIVVKPNFAPDPGAREGAGSYALFVGRLSVEKGIATLLEASRMLRPEDVLKVVGTGPLADQVAARAAEGQNVEWLGPQPREAVVELMRGARFLVVPSICYENFPLVVVEAYALGVPVVVSDVGGLAALVRDGITGLRVHPGDAPALARMIAWAHAHPAELEAMGTHARREFEEKYTPEENHRLLLAVYEDAIAHAYARN